MELRTLRRLPRTVVLGFALSVYSVATADASLLVYEGFDIATGALNGQSGATSTGWLAPWNSGSFLSPSVNPGSITPPLSTAGYYTASPIGNHVDTFANPAAPFGAGALGSRRFMSLEGNPSLYWTVLAQPDVINGSPAGQMSLTFDIPGQFQVVARPSGPDSSDPITWQLFLPGVTVVDTGVLANQTSLLAFQLDFNGAASLVADQFSFWVNKNPLVDAPTYQGMHDFGSTVWGVGADGGFSFSADPLTNSALVDEFRLGTDWNGVGINTADNAVPEPSGWMLGMLGVATLGAVQWQRRRRHALTGCW